MKRVVLAMAVALLSGCAESVSDLTCADVEDEVVALSEGNLLKIVNSREASRSEDRVVCRGIGVYADGSDIETRYQAYRDEDDELMFMFDIDDAQQRQEAAFEAQIDRELRQGAENLQRELNSMDF